MSITPGLPARLRSQAENVALDGHLNAARYMREAAEILDAYNGFEVTGAYLQRPDLALGACQVAAKTDQLDVAQGFAQTAIDFLTGNYDPENFDVESPA